MSSIQTTFLLFGGRLPCIHLRAPIALPSLHAMLGVLVSSAVTISTIGLGTKHALVMNVAMLRVGVRG